MTNFFFTLKTPIKILLLTPLLTLLGCAANSDYDFNNAWTRGLSSFTIAFVLLYYLNKQLFSGAKHPETPDGDQIKYVLAMNATTFALTGAALAVTATYRWEIALLLSGSCLLGGGFLGLLFGFPQGVAQRADNSKSPDAASKNKDKKAAHQNQGTPAQGKVQAVDPNPLNEAKDENPGEGTPAASSTDSKDANDGKANQPVSTNLLAESAATLGKVVAGFSLAKIGDIQNQLWNMSVAIAPIVGNNNEKISTILAESMILYFVATGFLSGLFLPSYFMKGRFS